MNMLDMPVYGLSDNMSDTGTTHGTCDMSGTTCPVHMSGTSVTCTVMQGQHLTILVLT